MTTTKVFMVVDHPLAKIGEIRPMVEKWCKARNYKLVRIWYGMEAQHQTIDQIKVEYER